LGSNNVGLGSNNMWGLGSNNMWGLGSNNVGLGSNNMWVWAATICVCLGFTRHISMGGMTKEKCSCTLYWCLHLRPAAAAAFLTSGIDFVVS
jgi:hypothetical protein